MVLFVELLSRWLNLFLLQSLFLPSQLPKCWHSQHSHVFSAVTLITRSHPPPLWPLPWDAIDVRYQVPKVQGTQDSTLCQWSLDSFFQRGLNEGTRSPSQRWGKSPLCTGIALLKGTLPTSTGTSKDTKSSHQCPGGNGSGWQNQFWGTLSVNPAEVVCHLRWESQGTRHLLLCSVVPQSKLRRKHPVPLVCAQSLH